MIRPQQKKNKAIQKMRENLKVGDKVVTIGGINGTIIKISDEILTLEIGADKLKLQFSKWAIGTIEEQ
jgi:preprotein translocase subunit YajC